MEERSELHERAVHEREAGNSLEAGEYYTAAAFQSAGNVPIYPSPGGAVKHFLEAATCYRIAGRMDRCRNRCRMGVLWAEDLSDRALSGTMPERDIHHADRGGWQEAIGMLRLVGDLDGVEEAYERAFEVFEAAGDPASHRAEIPKTTLYTWFTSIEQAATQDVRGMSFRREQSYIEYANYVRERIPEYLEVLEEQGRWSVPDSE